MRLPVASFDPSLTHWGWATANIDLQTGDALDLKIGTIITEKQSGKGIKPNRDDLRRGVLLAQGVIPLAQGAKVIFAEIPTGSQSASAMKSYGFCVMLLASLRAQGHFIIEVDPTTVKELFTGDKWATKREMIKTAVSLFPQADWPRHGKAQRVVDGAEHMADAVAIINAGMQSPEFSQFLEHYAP